jgi:hypothetical protein
LICVSSEDRVPPGSPPYEIQPWALHAIGTIKHTTLIKRIFAITAFPALVRFTGQPNGRQSVRQDSRPTGVRCGCIGETNREYERGSARFTEAYLNIIEKHAGTAYIDADLARQDAMRRNWLEDRFFSDPFTGDVLPYEV